MAAANPAPPRALSAKELDIQMMLAAEVHLGTKNCDFQMERYVFKRRNDARPKPNPPVLTLDDPNNTRATSVEKYKNLPKLPLIKANAVGVWHVDAAELEVKVLGEANKKVKVKMSVEEWKMFVEKKREVGERLMWQYAQDYEQSRGQNADIKMLVTTQRSGTAADKVSAFSVLIGDNPMANLRSLDALVGE
ncbi:unnamed protein product [Linum trigynum]|uniref:Uncharacterized protein n=1 Tax=Linum trigynum TaxID=586398 RepID=A0AAV2ECK7_9ROSI